MGMNSPARPRAGWEVAVKLPLLATPWEHRPMAVSGHHAPATGEPGVTLLGKAQPETQAPVCPHSTDCRSRSPRTGGLALLSFWEPVPRSGPSGDTQHVQKSSSSQGQDQGEGQ